MSRQNYIPTTETVEPIIGREYRILPRPSSWFVERPNPMLKKFMSTPTGQKNTARLIIPVATRLYRSITLDQPASDLTNFPVLFAGIYSYLKTILNGGKVNNSNGYDIVFYSDAQLTTKLDFERVYYNGATGEVEFWVKIPTLTSATATVIYISYGNPSITTDQQNATGVWDSNYQGVWHLPNGTSLSPNDSTSNGYHFSTSDVSAVTGKINGGVAANNANARLYSTGSGLFITGDKITVSGWFKPTNTNSDPGLYERLLVREISNGVNLVDPYVMYGLFRVANTPDASMQIATGGAGSQTSATLTNVFSAGVWVYIVGVYDGVNITIYKNGTTTASTPKTGNIGSGDDFVSGVNSYRLSSGAWYNGSADELRISNIQRTATWIETEYNNQNDPDSFYTIGSETNA